MVRRAADLLIMTMVLLAVLGWSVVSVLAAGLWSAVLVGARNGEARNVPAWRRATQRERVVPDFLPSPRTTTADVGIAV